MLRYSEVLAPIEVEPWPLSTWWDRLGLKALRYGKEECSRKKNGKIVPRGTLGIEPTFLEVLSVP